MDHALALAELEPRAQLYEQRQLARKGLPAEAALDLYVDANDNWPGWNRLRAFCRQANVRLDQSYEPPWEQVIERGKASRRERGLSCPDQIVTLRKSAPAIQLPEPGTVAALPRIARNYSREAVIEALREFDRSLPPGARRTRDKYLDWRSGRNLPAPRVFDRLGGFTELMEEAIRANADERNL